MTAQAEGTILPTEQALNQKKKNSPWLSGRHRGHLWIYKYHVPRFGSVTASPYLQFMALIHKIIPFH